MVTTVILAWIYTVGALGTAFYFAAPGFRIQSAPQWFAAFAVLLWPIWLPSRLLSAGLRGLCRWENREWS